MGAAGRAAVVTSYSLEAAAAAWDQVLAEAEWLAAARRGRLRAAARVAGAALRTGTGSGAAR